MVNWVFIDTFSVVFIFLLYFILLYPRQTIKIGSELALLRLHRLNIVPYIWVMGIH